MKLTIPSKNTKLTSFKIDKTNKVQETTHRVRILRLLFWFYILSPSFDVYWEEFPAKERCHEKCYLHFILKKSL